jgi:ribonucleoside-triphosphate reductase
LEELHKTIKKVLSENIGKEVSETVIADIINSIGVAVVSGNVRRSAELLLGEHSEEFMSLKIILKTNEEKNGLGQVIILSLVREEWITQ